MHPVAPVDCPSQVNDHNDILMSWKQHETTGTDYFINPFWLRQGNWRGPLHTTKTRAFALHRLKVTLPCVFHILQTWGQPNYELFFNVGTNQQAGEHEIHLECEESNWQMFAVECKWSFNAGQQRASSKFCTDGVFSPAWTRWQSSDLTCDWQNGGSHWSLTCHVTSHYARTHTVSVKLTFFVVLRFSLPNKDTVFISINK